MRFYISFFLVWVFAFGTVDFISARGAVNPKTCCGRQICSCTHAHGQKCDFKKSGHVSHKAPVKTGLTAAPCHTSTPRTVLPQYSKDSQVPAGTHADIQLRETSFTPSLKFLHGILSDLRLDRPPRLLSPSF